MATKRSNNKPKKIVFTEEIDSAINGFAVGISFTGIGIFLLLRPDYFAIPFVSYVLGAIIGVFGVLGTGFELSKYSKVEGLGNITAGVVLLGIWALAYVKFHALWLNILFFFILVMGCFTLSLGLLQSAVSIIHNIRRSRRESLLENKEQKLKGIGSALTQIVLFLTQLCGLLLAIINVLKAIPQ